MLREDFIKSLIKEIKPTKKRQINIRVKLELFRFIKDMQLKYRLTISEVVILALKNFKELEG